MNTNQGNTWKNKLRNKIIKSMNDKMVELKMRSKLNENIPTEN